MKKNLILLAIILVGAIGGYLYGRYMQPPKVETQIKEVQTVKKEIKTVVKEVVRKDGTKETITTTEEESISEFEKEMQSRLKRNDWNVSISYGKDIDDMTDVYGLNVQRRILDSLFIGGQINSDKQLGVSLGVEF